MKKREKKVKFSIILALLKSLIIFVVLFSLNLVLMGLLGYLLMFPILLFCNVDSNNMCNTCYGAECWAAIIFYGTIAILLWSIIIGALIEFIKVHKKNKL